MVTSFFLNIFEIYIYSAGAVILLNPLNIQAEKRKSIFEKSSGLLLWIRYRYREAAYEILVKNFRMEKKLPPSYPSSLE